MIDYNMDFIDTFIPSKDTRAYLHSIHHEFSDLEKATIVANHYMITYDDKIGWLMDFKDRVSSEDLRERIINAISFIKSEKESYDKGWLCDYNEALFDFVFIPHDFRHGDIVRSLYGEWNTTPYCEKIGIILGYFDTNYDFYRNMKGDYSDVQITVDTIFDGVKYQGEFSHQHINPIYIERVTLQEKDERRPYLDYFINIYAQNLLCKKDMDKPIFEEIAKGSSNSDLETAKWDDILINYAKNHFAEEKSVMVLTVIYPYDTVEVLGVFDDKAALRKACITIIGKDKSLVDDISNLHIYECPLNKMIGVFYPDDYDNADSIGSFFEEQKDISAEILGEEFLEAIKER